jgi:hypothetical protein
MRNKFKKKKKTRKIKHIDFICFCSQTLTSLGKQVPIFYEKIKEKKSFHYIFREIHE